jgi:predicted enzyme related to lactoylglutathione lyase
VTREAYSHQVSSGGFWPGGAGAEGGPIVTFQPQAGLEKTVDDLQNQGVDVPAGISEHPWGRVATFKDSEGNNVQLYEPPKD